jgi:hypothetical protein
LRGHRFHAAAFVVACAAFPTRVAAGAAADAETKKDT